MTIVDTPEGIRFFQMLQCQGALRIQRDTGLTHSQGSVLKLVKRRYGVQGMRIKSACEQMDALVEGAKAARTALTSDPSEVPVITSPYSNRNAHERQLLRMFIKGAEMMGLTLESPTAENDRLEAEYNDA